VIEGSQKSGRDDIFFLTHGGPINTPDDLKTVLPQTESIDFIGTYRIHPRTGFIILVKHTGKVSISLIKLRPNRAL